MSFDFIQKKKNAFPKITKNILQNPDEFIGKYMFKCLLAKFPEDAANFLVENFTA